MEKRLQDFILSVQQLSDLRNLDVFNPITFQMEHPITATRYTIVGAKMEPSYLGLPINVTWVVLDPTDPYYLKALKLKTTIDLETVTDKPQIIGINAWWHVVRTYEEIFADPQYYMGVAGIEGPVGPTGPAGAIGINGVDGAQGPAGTVDMNLFLQLAMAQLGQLPGTLEIRGPSLIPSAGSAQYELWLTESQLDVNGQILPAVPRQVFAPIVMMAGSATPLPVGTTITSAGLLQAGATVGDVAVRLVAEYPSWTRMVQQQKDLTIGSKTLVTVTINGVASSYAGDTHTFTALATYSDGTTALVSPVWSVDNTQIASVTAMGVATFTDPIPQDASVVLTASFDGIDVTKTIAVQQLVAASLVINGASVIPGGSAAAYTATLTLNSGAVSTVVPTWSLAVTVDASVDAMGTITANNVSTALVLNASYLVPGTSASITASKNISVTLIATVIYPYFGPGPAAPTDWTAFITSLPYRGPTADVNAAISFDCVGQNTYMYFAAPKSYGFAQFFDQISQFFGGWGGGGASGPGPSNASVAAGADIPFTTSVMIDGTPVDFYVYRSDYANLGLAASNRWLASPAP